MIECIEREAAIKAIRKEYDYQFPTASGVFDEFATKIVPSILNSIPTVEVIPTTWTLADEALPQNGEDVLCWYEYFRFGKYNRMYQTFGIGYQFNGNWGGEVAQGQKAKVLAWIPLPKPPKMNGGAENG